METVGNMLSRSVGRDRLRISIVALAIVGTLWSAQSLAQFDRYPVSEVYRGPARMPDFQGRDRDAKDYRTRIRNGIKEGANFAGRYKVIQFGCGTGCAFVYVADVSTGKCTASRMVVRMIGSCD
jgi:hypothetical protein